MTSLYILVDQFGLIGGFDNYEVAKKLIDTYPKIPLMIIEFPMDQNSQKEEFYFLPYVGNNAIAIASNNKDYVFNIKTQLMTISMTYPDPLSFFTREINKIHELELKRLLSPELHIGDDNLLSNINEVVDKMESMTGVGGMYHEQYNILNKVYGDVVSQMVEEEKNNQPLQTESNDDTKEVENDS